jgi:hypothetical protein
MIGRKSVVSAVALVALVYAVAPYITLWRLATALREGDASTLEAVIDWDAVRGGLKEDVAEGIVGLPEDNATAAPTQLASNTLPPFGASFISGIAGSMIDREVTPQHLIALMRQLAPEDPSGIGFGAMVRSLGGIDHAFFDGPASFTLRMHCAGQDVDDAPLRVRMEMHGGAWRVVRAWVPQDLIERANSRT